MCGRISQYLHGETYFHVLRLPEQQADDSELEPAGPRYNVPPGTKPRVISMSSSKPVMSREAWGYRGPTPRLNINARVETAYRLPLWRGLWNNGRVIVPADGWYEWTGEKAHRQPNFIRRSDGAPIFLAAIAAPEGFAIVTAAADEGLLDVHDRRPVALEPEDALAWLDPDRTEEAREIAARTLPASSFVWYPVAKAASNARNDSPTFIEPLQPEPAE